MKEKQSSNLLDKVRNVFVVEKKHKIEIDKQISEVDAILAKRPPAPSDIEKLKAAQNNPDLPLETRTAISNALTEISKLKDQLENPIEGIKNNIINQNQEQINLSILPLYNPEHLINLLKKTYDEYANFKKTTAEIENMNSKDYIDYFSQISYFALKTAFLNKRLEKVIERERLNIEVDKKSLDNLKNIIVQKINPSKIDINQEQEFENIKTKYNENEIQDNSIKELIEQAIQQEHKIQKAEELIKQHTENLEAAKIQENEIKKHIEEITPIAKKHIKSSNAKSQETETKIMDKLIDIKLRQHIEADNDFDKETKAHLKEERSTYTGLISVKSALEQEKEKENTNSIEQDKNDKIEQENELSETLEALNILLNDEGFNQNILSIEELENFLQNNELNSNLLEEINFFKELLTSSTSINKSTEDKSIEDLSPKILKEVKGYGEKITNPTGLNNTWTDLVQNKNNEKSLLR